MMWFSLDGGPSGKGEDRVTDVARPAVLLGPVVPCSSCGSLHGINRNLARKSGAGVRRADGNESGIHPLADWSVQGGGEKKQNKGRHHRRGGDITVPRPHDAWTRIQGAREGGGNYRRWAAAFPKQRRYQSGEFLIAARAFCTRHLTCLHVRLKPDQHQIRPHPHQRIHARWGSLRTSTQRPRSTRSKLVFTILPPPPHGPLTLAACPRTAPPPPPSRVSA